MRTFYVSVLVWMGFGMFVQAGDRNSPLMKETMSVSSDTGEVQIRLQYSRGHVGVRGAFKNESTGADTLTYELEVRKTGTAGTSVTRQSGSFRTRPGDVERLSTSTVSVQSGDRLAVHLVVRDGTHLVGERMIDRTIP